MLLLVVVDVLVWPVVLLLLAGLKRASARSGAGITKTTSCNILIRGMLTVTFKSCQESGVRGRVRVGDRV